MERTINYFSEKEISDFFYTLKQETLKTENYAKKRAVRNYALFCTMYYCGLRVTEVCLMKTDSYKKRNQTIYCERINGSINNKLKILQEYEFISNALNTHIKLNSPNTYMFTNLSNKDTPISRKTVDVIFHKTCEKAGLNDVNMNSYILRHSIGMHLVQKGLDITELQYWLGHSNLTSTISYYKQMNNEIDTKQIYNKMQQN